MTRVVRSRSKSSRSSRSSQPNRSAWRWLLGLFGVSLGATAVAGAGLSAWSYWSRSIGTTSKLVFVSATSENAIAEQLAEAGLVGSARLMALYLATLGRFGALQAGQHLLPAAASPRTLAQCLFRDASRPEVEFTIPEGFDHVRVAQRLEALGICPALAFTDTVRQRDTLDHLGIRGRDGEGYLFPATYRLPLDAVPERLFARFVRETRNRLRRMEEKLGNAPFEALAAGRGWGELEILTLASLIEKEAQRDEERPVIASVFLNRLDDESFRPRRMLQSDPTAGYGCLVLGETIASCREYQHRILPSMLRDAANPYNSYRHPGLPPGPIASPGEASIVAVLKPAVTKYLYFVAIGDGRHRFSSTYEEHDGHVHSGGP